MLDVSAFIGVIVVCIVVAAILSLFGKVDEPPPRNRDDVDSGMFFYEDHDRGE